jgi:hypothetical protein
MDLLLAVVLALLGIGLLLLPILGVSISRLRLGRTEIAMSSPIRFRSTGPALLSVAVALACLAAAALLADVPARLAGTGPEAPPSAEETGIAAVDPETGRISLRLLIPDSMGGYTPPPEIADGEVSATVESLFAPLNSVGCLLLRSAGEETRPSEHYRPPGSVNWPRSGYMFCASHLGVWAFARFDDGVPTYIRSWLEGKSIRKTAANNLHVRMVGDEFVLTINDVEVDRVVDGIYPSGATGVTCGSPAGTEPAAVCHFDGYSATPLP